MTAATTALDAVVAVQALGETDAARSNVLADELRWLTEVPPPSKVLPKKHESVYSTWRGKC